MENLHPNLVISPTKAHLRLFSVMRGRSVVSCRVLSSVFCVLGTERRAADMCDAPFGLGSLFSILNCIDKIT